MNNTSPFVLAIHEGPEEVLKSEIFKVLDFFGRKIRLLDY